MREERRKRSKKVREARRKSSKKVREERKRDREAKNNERASDYTAKKKVLKNNNSGAQAHATNTTHLITLVALAQNPGGVGFETFNTSSGKLRTFSTLGPISPQRNTNPFFLPVVVNGQTNGKTCEHCHFASDGWGLIVDHADQLFDDSQGLHPLPDTQQAEP